LTHGLVIETGEDEHLSIAPVTLTALDLPLRLLLTVPLQGTTDIIRFLELTCRAAANVSLVLPVLSSSRLQLRSVSPSFGPINGPWQPMCWAELGMDCGTHPHAVSSTAWHEVKTTRDGPETDFFISAHEVEFSRRRASNFCLYRVYEFRFV
jgi:uncharacterized protein DUF3883